MEAVVFWNGFAPLHGSHYEFMNEPVLEMEDNGSPGVLHEL